MSETTQFKSWLQLQNSDPETLLLLLGHRKEPVRDHEKHGQRRRCQEIIKFITREYDQGGVTVELRDPVEWL